MKYCGKCGAQINDNDSFCAECGARIVEPTTQLQYNQIPLYPPPYYNIPYPVYKPDSNSTGLNILSFCFPFIGFILYLVYKNEKPIKAKGCGICALVSFIVNIILLPIMIFTR